MASVGELRAIAQKLAAKTDKAVEEEGAALRALEDEERKLDEAARALGETEDVNERWALEEKRQVLIRMKAAVTGKLATLERQQALASAAMLAPLEEAEQSNLIDIREEYDEALHGPLRQPAAFHASSGAGPKPYSHTGKPASSDDQTLMARLDELERAEAAAEATGQAKTPQETKPNQAYKLEDRTTSVPVNSGEGPAPSEAAGVPPPGKIGNGGKGDLPAVDKGRAGVQGKKPKPAHSGLRAGFFNAAPRGKPSKSAGMPNPLKGILKPSSQGASGVEGVPQGSESSRGISAGTPSPSLPAGKTLEAPGLGSATLRVQERGPKATEGSGHVGSEKGEGTGRVGGEKGEGSGRVVGHKGGGGQGSGDAKGFGCFAGDGGWQDFSAELGLPGREGEGGEESGAMLGFRARDGPRERVVGLQGEEGQGRTEVGEETLAPADGGGIKKGRKMSMFMQQRSQMKKSVGM